MNNFLEESQELKTLKFKQKEQTPYLNKFLRNEKGNIKTNSLSNMKLIIENEPILKGKFKFNEFSSKVEIVEEIPEINIKKGYLTDLLYVNIIEYIERQAKFQHAVFQKDKVIDAINITAHENSYNPVLDYMENCYKNYDGEERLKTFFHTFLGAEQTHITEKITKMFFVGAVAKVYDPSTKFDFVLDLVGGQGVGKTTLLKKIAPLNTYSDQFYGFSGKDNYLAMLECLILNDDEMTATNSSSFEEIKKFVTSEKMIFRNAYEKEVSHYSKSFVLARTTNELTYLKDKTGERRFLPILANKDEQILHPACDLKDDYVEKLWGEAVDLYKKGFEFTFDKNEEKEIEKYRNGFVHTDDLEDSIEIALDHKFVGRSFIGSQELADEVLEGMRLAKNRKMSNRINYIMTARFGYVKGTRRLKGVPTKGFLKK